MILGPNGQPIKSSTSPQTGYVPKEMAVFGSLVNKISGQPEHTFQVLIPMERFEEYMDNPQAFTLTIQHFVAYNYGTQILKEEPTNDEQVGEWRKKVAELYSVSLSEPLGVDIIYRDSSPLEGGKNANSNGETPN